MIAEQLIRSGQAFLQGVALPTDLLKMLSDSDDDKTKNFWQHVLIVEIDTDNGDIAVQPVQSWGSLFTLEGSKKQGFRQDKRAALAPIWLPTGGNPLHAQGFYGFPIYPVYDRHWSAFSEHPKGVRSFLAPRLEKTANVELNESLLETICRQVHETVKSYGTDEKAVMILALTGEESAFRFSPTPCPETYLSPSQLFPNHVICAHTDVILARIWEAKAREGAEKGELKEGVCAFTGKRGQVISGDNKAWPWFTTTWEAPFPGTFGKIDHVKRLAFSPDAYKNLTIGATLFGKLTKQLNYNLNKQLFAPVDSAKGREGAMKGQVKDTTLGSAIVTPLLDDVNLDNEEKMDFADGMRRKRLDDRSGKGAKLFPYQPFGLRRFFACLRWLMTASDLPVSIFRATLPERMSISKLLSKMSYLRFW